MRERLLGAFLLIACMLITFFYISLQPLVTDAEELNVSIDGVDTTLYSAHVTTYLDVGYTKSGKYTRSGICAAKEEWLGCVAVIYQRLPDDSIGECLGMFEILDTGGTQGLKNGNVIDVWMPDSVSSQDFIDKSYENNCQGKIYVQIVRGEG